MQTFNLSLQANLKNALANIRQVLPSIKISTSLSIMQPISNLEKEDFYTIDTNFLRFFYQSKEQSCKYLGIAQAHEIASDSYEKALDSLMIYKNYLTEHQIYFGGIRFAQHSNISKEWQDFLTAKFVLPLVMLAQIDKKMFLQINYISFGNYNIATWFDRVFSILNLFQAPKKIPYKITQEYKSNKENYTKLVNKALKSFSNKNQKVVLARKNSFLLNDKINSFWFVQKLLNLPENLFIFLFDLGNHHYFLGHSPELLFSNQKKYIISEALAGTVVTNTNEKEIFNHFSSKEHSEHKYVKNWIKDIFTDLSGVIIDSQMQIQKAFCVYHLQQRFTIYLDNVNEKDLLLKLHPTPAVCGFTKEYAQEFIKANEDFDRGYYTGAIGIIGKENSEFCVAIRSGLVCGNILHLYAACGIVQGSWPDAEWDELDAKQKALLRLFD